MKSLTEAIKIDQPTLVQIRFVPAEQAGEQVCMRFSDPASAVANWKIVPSENLTASSALPLDELHVFLIPSHLPTDAQSRTQAEAWIDAAGCKGPPPTRAVVEGGWILWRAGQAVVHAPAGRLAEFLSALVEFSFYEAQLRDIEQSIHADWPQAQADMVFIHDAKHPDEKQFTKLGEMTQRVTGRRMTYSRIERVLYAPSDQLPVLAQKAGQRLRDEIDIDARIEDVDQKIETCQDLYESINQRVGEERHFRSELFMEIIIALLLFLEVLMFIWDIRLQYME